MMGTDWMKHFYNCNVFSISFSQFYARALCFTPALKSAGQDNVDLKQRCPTLSPFATCGDRQFKCGDRKFLQRLFNSKKVY